MNDKKKCDIFKLKQAFPVDSLMICSDDAVHWCDGHYCGFIDNCHKVFFWGLTSKETEFNVSYRYIIPYKKFDPRNIEESLKYNIQK